MIFMIVGYINYPAYQGQGYATVFPQSLALAASFNVMNLHKVGRVIATEARALNNWYVSRGLVETHTGLNCWAPNINIARDPRWGRNQETYGEDPYLTSRMTVAYVKAVQGNHKKYYEAIATCKHYDAVSIITMS
jgi:beta-glucosidase